ncbi:MAG TPA: ABC transporter substrate-binding protein [Gemmatimonadaceae bacterium]|nr:ABC transporter substrate-binding protein [Gemmatimonadaceae bacterium]
MRIASLRGTGRAPLAAGVLLALAGCRNARDPALDRGATVVVAVEDVGAMKPDAKLDFLTFLSLATLDEHGELAGRLARSWEHSADFKEWTYHLRTDVRWDDGKPVTARDVKFTLDLLAKAGTGYTGINATIVDDSTVRIRAANQHYVDDIVYYPEHLLAALDPAKFWEWNFWTQPVGNGPFRFVRYLPERLIEFEANPRYYKGKPRIQRVIAKFVGKAGMTELLSGNADIVQGEPGQIPRIASDPRFRIHNNVVPPAFSIYWKADHPLFRDSRVRRALTLAIDRRELLRFVNLPPDAPITDAVLTYRQLRRREWPKPLPYDTARARMLLAAAGWAERNGDGVLEKDGRPFRFTASVGSGLDRDKLAVYVQAQLRRVGVQMHIQMVDAPVMWNKLRAGDFEAWMHVQQSGALRRDFGSGNPLGYANAQAFELTDRLQQTADPEVEDRIYREISEIFLTDPPMVRLVPYSNNWFVHRRIRGLSTPFHAQPDTYMEDLWVEDGKP